MTDQEKECKECPEGQVLRDGKCVMPEVTFTAFIMSLNTAALFHFGELVDPETGESNQDIVLAKHTNGFKRNNTKLDIVPPSSPEAVKFLQTVIEIFVSSLCLTFELLYL